MMLAWKHGSVEVGRSSWSPATWLEVEQTEFTKGLDCGA